MTQKMPFHEIVMAILRGDFAIELGKKSIYGKANSEAGMTMLELLCSRSFIPEDKKTELAKLLIKSVINGPLKHNYFTAADTLINIYQNNMVDDFEKTHHLNKDQKQKLQNLKKAISIRFG